MKVEHAHARILREAINFVLNRVGKRSISNPDGVSPGTYDHLLRQSGLYTKAVAPYCTHIDAVWVRASNEFTCIDCGFKRCEFFSEDFDSSFAYKIEPHKAGDKITQVFTYHKGDEKAHAAFIEKYRNPLASVIEKI